MTGRWPYYLRNGIRIAPEAVHVGDAVPSTDGNNASIHRVVCVRGDGYVDTALVNEIRS